MSTVSRLRLIRLLQRWQKKVRILDLTVISRNGSPSLFFSLDRRSLALKSLKKIWCSLMNLIPVISTLLIQLMC